MRLTVSERFERIRVCVVPNGVDTGLDEWIGGLRQRGITRWWRDRGSRKFGPEEILQALTENRLDRLGMSEQVAQTVREAFTDERRMELAALHTPDEYLLELRLDNGEYRAMESLSGGQQVSLLLSLLLQTGDDRPLVIDQPEEELDKAYLFSTVLPALRALKGRRQVIFATHDANIVVNGDADQVIHIQADAERGWVAAQGAIEDRAIRDAVLTVLDGGKDAFEMRFRKYGF
ncbi:MAG TPA: AAA family ATPase [Methylococcus sp.]|nr:AAA family ATPase [Methylococcus sp.]